MNPVHSLPPFLRQKHSFQKKENSIPLDPTSSIQQIFIDPKKIEGLSNFRQKYRGKILILGPENQLTSEKISQLIKACEKVLDKDLPGIYTKNELTLCYSKM